MTDDPNKPQTPDDDPAKRPAPQEAGATGDADKSRAADDKAPSPGGEVRGAGTLPPPPDAGSPATTTPETQTPQLVNPPSGHSDTRTTTPAPKTAEASPTPAAETAAPTPATETAAATPSTAAAPPADETADEKKARLIAQAKARAAAAKEAGASKAAGAAGAGAAGAGGAGAAAGGAGAGATAAGAGAPKAPVKKKDEGPKPEDASNHPLVKRLREKTGDAVLEATTFLGQLSVRVAPASVVETCRNLRDDAETPFNFLCDLTCVHFPERAEAPFEVVYNLYSIAGNQRVRLKASTAGEIESVTGVWPAANWMEREVYDLFGVVFRNHPDLRRLLLPPDWEGHPFRKEYPLSPVENAWTAKHLPEFTDVQREQLEQRRAYGLEFLSVPEERTIRDIFRAGRDPMPLDRKG